MQNPITYFTDYMRHLIDLKDGLDVEGTIFEIKNNRRMMGANAWMLMCSIVIASLGLDLNSPAVIIGAMLISPLMAPILGVGLGVGIADTDTVKTALQHFGVAIIIALITSTLYFLITPFGDPTNEILSRTQPTLLDVMIAFFGGVAGIVSSSRKDKTNAIPGVAIATALMPPLCVTGFGIAHGNIEIMLNSFYLFFLNSFFVALATYLMVRWLDFPIVKSMDGRSRTRVIALMVLLSLILIIPSIFILRKVIMNLTLNNHAQVFIDDYFENRHTYIDDWTIVKGDPNKLIMKVYGDVINYSDTSECKEALLDAGLPNTKLQIIPTSEINLDKFNELESQVRGMQEINAKIEQIEHTKFVQDYRIDSLKAQLAYLQSDSTLVKTIQDEVKILFPELTYFAIGKMDVADEDIPRSQKSMVVINWNKKLRKSAIQPLEKKLLEYLKYKFVAEEIELVYK